MAYSIYLGNDSIHILVGRRAGERLVVKHAVSIPLPEGIIINGIITDPTRLREALQSLLKSEKKRLHGKPELVVDSGMIQTKVAQLPALSENKLRKLVPGEFVDAIQNPGQALYDYSVISRKSQGGSGVTLLCAAAERQLVESYIDLFTGLNINLAGIRLGLDCLMRLCGAVPELRDKTYMMFMLDGNVLVQLLFVEGMYVFSQRHRLLEPRGSAGIIDEVVRRASYMLQFSKSQTRDRGVSQILLAGLTAGEDGLGKAIEQTTGIDTMLLPESPVKNSEPGFRLADYCYTAGSFLG